MPASVFDKIRAAKKRLEYPPVGECRVCGKPYARGTQESGRSGMCDIHYRASNDAVKKGETTWEALHDKFPMTTGRGAVTSTRARYAPPAEAQKLLESEFQNSVTVKRILAKTANGRSRVPTIVASSPPRGQLQYSSEEQSELLQP